MPTSAHRRSGRAGGLVALLVAGAIALAACGSGGAGSGTVGAVAQTAMNSPFSDLQQQFVQVVQTVSPEVVQIQSPLGLGSGVVFDKHGDIVTNAHVVEGSHKFVVTLANGQQHPATLVGSDMPHDIAVVHVSGATPTPATFGDSGTLQVGDLVLAIGNPLGLRSSVTQGIVSSLARNVSEGNGVTLSGSFRPARRSIPATPGARWSISRGAWSGFRRSRPSTRSSGAVRRWGSGSPFRARHSSRSRRA